MSVPTVISNLKGTSDAAGDKTPLHVAVIGGGGAGVDSSTTTAPARTTQGTSAATVLAANTLRVSVRIQNVGTTVLYFSERATDPTITVYHFALSACATADDGTGGTYVSDTYKGEIRAISSGASGAMSITEFT